MHKNTVIRDELTSILTVSGSGINVYNSRLRELPDKNLPAISIYIQTESAVKTVDELGYLRQPQVVIVCYVKGLDRTNSLASGEKSVDEKLDDMYQFLEDKLLTQYNTLNQTIFRFDFTGVSNVTADNLGENGIKLISYTNWTARYHQQIA
jgi:hypothetical protein